MCHNVTMLKKALINNHLRYIINYINTSPEFIKISDLLNWCEDEGYVKSFFENLSLITYMIDQHNLKFYIKNE